MAEEPLIQEPKPTSNNMRNLLISLAALVLVVAIIALFFLLSGPTCPESCDDSNSCTADSCNERAGRCVHSPLNGNYGACSGWVGVCKRRTCENGMCVEKIRDDCCGNGICEADESYETCEGDCPIPPVETNCGDGVDNDGDGLIDCEDPDCECEEGEEEEEEEEEDAEDCCDPDVDCVEICDNGKDDDCDGLTDCDDPDCEGVDECQVDCEDLILINEFVVEFGRSVMDAEEDGCNDIPQGEWRSKVNEVGCYTHNNKYFDCEDLESEVRYAQFMDFCEELNADWECQNNYWGCMCDKEPLEDLELETDDNCGDGLDNDGDGLIDCMDSECCPPDYDQESGIQCCCEDFFDSPDWEPHWPNCEDQFCYEGVCQEAVYVWGSVCECLEEPTEIECEDIQNPNSQEDCDPGFCSLPDSECMLVGDMCECLYDCSGGDNPNANAEEWTCENLAWCRDYNMPCWWYSEVKLCACPPIL